MAPNITVIDLCSDSNSIEASRIHHHHDTGSSGSDAVAGCARLIDWRNSHHHKNKRQKGKARHHEFPVTGFDEGLEVEDILGVKDCQEGLFYLIKWKGRSDMEFVPALVAFFHAPGMVIQFYAKRISWIGGADADR